METVKVAGHEGLRKDLQTNAVINSDSNAFQKARDAKQKRLEELMRVESLENKVQRLETMLEKLLEGRE